MKVKALLLVHKADIRRAMVSSSTNDGTRMLRGLPRDLAEKIGFGNGERLLGGPAQ